MNNQANQTNQTTYNQTTPQTNDVVNWDKLSNHLLSGATYGFKVLSNNTLITTCVTYMGGLYLLPKINQYINHNTSLNDYHINRRVWIPLRILGMASSSLAVLYDLGEMIYTLNMQDRKINYTAKYGDKFVNGVTYGTTLALLNFEI